MNPHRTNLALRIVAAVLAAAAAAVLVAGVAWRLESVDSPAARTMATAPPATRPGGASGATPSVEAFGPALARTLRPALGEPPPAPATAAAPAADAAVAASPARLRLVGTIGSSVALVKGPDGTVVLVEVGDDLEGADVVAIRDQQMDLRQGGRLIRMEKAPPPTGGEGVSISIKPCTAKGNRRSVADSDLQLRHGHSSWRLTPARSYAEVGRLSGGLHRALIPRLEPSAMSTPEFILFPGPRQWRVARGDGQNVTWHDVPIEPGNPGATAATTAELLAAQGYRGRPVVLAIASGDCLAARVSTIGLPRGDRRALAYRLEERLPLAAEDVVADFAPPSVSGDSLAACVRAGEVAPVIEALEAVGVAVGPVVPAAVAAAQVLGDAHGDDDGLLLLNEPHAADDAPMVSAVALQGGRPVEWALLPATVHDVRLHLELLAADLQFSPRVRAIGVDEAFTSGLAARSAGVVHRSDESPADAAAAFGFDLLAGHRRAWFDFRRDALAAVDPLRQYRRALNAALACAAVFFLALTVAAVVRTARYTRVAAESRAQLTATFRSHFPGWAVPANVRAVVAAEHRKAVSATDAPSAGGAAYGSAPETLRVVLGALPGGDGFALDALSIQDASLTLTGRLGGFEQADAIAAAARHSGMTVPPPQTRRTAGGTWAFVLQGTRPGDAVAGGGGAAGP